MLPRVLLFFFASFVLPALVHGQSAATPAQFRLIVPHGQGSILIDTSGGWSVERVVVYDHGVRPVVQMENKRLRLVASYMLDDEPKYNDTTEMCRNDMLGGVLKGALSKATVTHKASDTRILLDGQTMLLGSYLVEKVESLPLRQENVWGFLAKHHLCAVIHLSRTPFNSGDEKLFEPMLNTFRFEPDYQPTATDYAVMAKMLPPQMASLYGADSQTAPVVTAPKESLSPQPQSLRFALPRHNGLLTMDAPDYKVSELSAKPDGNEFGIRADDASLHTEVLGFLFLAHPPQPDAVACRDWMLKSEDKDVKQMGIRYRKVLRKREMVSDSGVPISIVDYEQSAEPTPSRFVRRFFVAKGDLCADTSIFAADESHAGPSDVILQTLRFEPNHEPDFFAKFTYANVIMDHHDPAAAAPYFEEAIALAGSTEDAAKWTRIATDQAAISYGMSGNVKHSRAINEAAIAKDPDYPLYYYNLACADAEYGNATAAREHLQQAFDRRTNVLKGEKMPDPAADDSILKLKKNKEFWSFVQSLPKN